MKSLGKLKPFLKRTGYIFLFLFLLINMVAFFNAWKLTHFDPEVKEKTKTKNISTAQKISLVLFGFQNPRSVNSSSPSKPFESIRLKSNKEIECWLIKANAAKGTVVLFHGYGGNKASMLDKATLFLKMGYNTFLVDFMGSGGSEGNQTTVGYYEAEEVKTVVEYLKQKGEKNVILFGTSMGAVSIMKAIGEDGLQVQAAILECPFGSMREAIEMRFKLVGAPSFPMTDLLLFWGSVQNRFNAYRHNPDRYAKGINCPVLLLYGERDDRVSSLETNRIFKNLNGPKKLRIYPEAGHVNYLLKYKEEWTTDVRKFLSQHAEPIR